MPPSQPDWLLRACVAIPLAWAALTVLSLAASAIVGPAPESPSARAQLALYLPIARAHWPRARCTGRERIIFDGPLWHRGRRVGGIAYPRQGCKIVLDPDQPPVHLCTLTIHETGHLAGRGHAPAGHPNVMQNDGDYIDPACARAVHERGWQ